MTSSDSEGHFRYGIPFYFQHLETHYVLAMTRLQTKRKSRRLPARSCHGGHHCMWCGGKVVSAGRHGHCASSHAAQCHLLLSPHEEHDLMQTWTENFIMTATKWQVQRNNVGPVKLDVRNTAHKLHTKISYFPVKPALSSRFSRFSCPFVPNLCISSRQAKIFKILPDTIPPWFPRMSPHAVPSTSDAIQCVNEWMNEWMNEMNESAAN